MTDNLQETDFYMEFISTYGMGNMRPEDYPSTQLMGNMRPEDYPSTQLTGDMGQKLHLSTDQLALFTTLLGRNFK